ncbi:MAG: hypothetical protein ACSHYB_10090 [Roseibacillus sp.]
MREATIIIVASFWIKKDGEDEFLRCERILLERLTHYDAAVISRIRNPNYQEGDESPYETHLLNFPSRKHWNAYLEDESLDEIRAACALVINRKSFWEGHELSK